MLITELSEPELLVWCTVILETILAWFHGCNSHFIDTMLHYFATDPDINLILATHPRSLLVKMFFILGYRKLYTSNWAVGFCRIFFFATHDEFFASRLREKLLVTCDEAVWTLISLRRLTQNWPLYI